MSGSALSLVFPLRRCLAVEVNNSASVITSKFSDGQEKPLKSDAVTKPNKDSLFTKSAILSNPSGFN